MTELGSTLDPRTLDELREGVGGDREFFAELVDDFLADAPAQLESLRETSASGDADGARRAAHTLKGTSRTFGAAELASICQEAEHAAAAGDLDAVLSRVEGIGAEWARVRADLLALRDGA
jgi:HPt (histidine-containing phosphotransfer) domain-containing protein